MLLDPQTQNSYAYARNNPIVYKDPDGMYPTAVAGALMGAPLGPLGMIGGAIIGAAVGTVAIVGGVWMISEASKAMANRSQATPVPGDIQGKSPADIDRQMKEKGWTGEPTKQGGGTRYPNPDKPGEQVRIQPGNPNDPNPAKQGPYGRISSDGKVSPPIPLQGNPTLP